MSGSVWYLSFSKKKVEFKKYPKKGKSKSSPPTRLKTKKSKNKSLKNFLFISLFFASIILFSSFISAAPINDTLHINLQTTDTSGDIETGTFTFAFNLTENSSSSCLGPVVYNHSLSQATDDRGIVSITLPTVGSGGGNLSALSFDTQYYLCYSRDGTLKDVSQLGRVPYSFRATQVNLSEISVDSNLNLTDQYNVTDVNTGFFSFLGSLIERVTTLFVQDINASGNINASGIFYGNGSGLTDIDSTTLDGFDSSFFMPLNTSVSGDFDFNGGWQNDGLSIVDGNIFAQSGFFVKINALNVSNLNTNGSLIPVLDNQFDIGNSTNRYRNLWIGSDAVVNGTLDVNEATLYVNSSSSEVGIGTTTPAEKLHIVAGSGRVLLGEPYVAGGFGGIGFGTSLGGNAYSLLGEGTNTYLNAPSGGSIFFRENNANKAALLSSGNFGINTVTPQNKLNVVGDVNVTENVYVGFNFTVDNNILFVNSNSDRVGIGTTNPSQALDVNGKIQIGNDAASAEAGAVRWTGSVFEGYNGTAWNSFASASNASGSTPWIENGSLIYYTGGNVGIGVTLPDELLDVRGLSDPKVKVTDTTNTVQTILQSKDTLGYVGTESGHALRIITNNTDRITVDTSGNVGIGTTSPNALLDIRDTDANNPQIRIHNSTGTEKVRLGDSGSSNDGNLQLFDSDGTLRTLIRGSATDNSYINSGGGNVGIGTTSPAGKLHLNFTIEYPLVLQDTADGSDIRFDVAGGELRIETGTSATRSQKMVIQSDGDVGIGTTSPTTILDLNSSGSSQITLDTTSSSTFNGIIFERNSVADGGIAYDTAQNALEFYTEDFSGDPQVTIDNTGQVGIGDTNPSEILEINHSSDPTILIARNDATVATDEIIGEIEFYSGDVSVGSTGVMANIEAIAQSGDETDLRFLVGHSTGSGSPTLVEAIRILATSGNVGIGTTSPETPLHVQNPSGGTESLRLTTNDYVLNTAGSKFNIGFGAASGNTFTKLDATDIGGNSVANLILQDSGGNVGIGTTTPGFKLNVASGTTNTAAEFNSTDAGVSIRFTDDTGSAQIGGVGNDIKFEPGPGFSEVARITSSGNVGIGTTNPTGAKLQIEDSSSTLIKTVDTGGTGTHTHFEIDNTNGNIGQLKTVNNDFQIQATNATGDIDFLTGGANERVKIDSSGNVGIGTTSPGFKLDIDVGATNADGIRLVGSSNPKLQFNHTGGGQAWHITPVTDGGFRFSQTAVQDVLTLQNGTGNVGIGTTSPDDLLHVHGGSAGNIAAHANARVVIEDDVSSVLQFLTPNTTTAEIYFGDPEDLDEGFIGYDHSNERLSLGTDGGADVVIDATGNVGIGTTNPGATLEVAGEANFTGGFVSIDGTDASPTSSRVGIGEIGGTLGLQARADINLIIDSDADSSNALRIRAHDAFGGSPTELVKIEDTGNVGIGTTSPEDILHLSESSAGALGPVLAIDNPAASTLSNEAQIAFLTDVGASVSGTSNARLRAINRNAGTGAASFQIDTWDGSSEVSRIYITESGNIGIGTISPSQLFHVQTSSDTAHTNFTLQDRRMTFIDAAGNTNTETMFYIEDADNSASRLTFDFRGNSGSNSILAGTSAGNVGIGTVSPGAKLDVNSSSNVGARITTSDVSRLDLYSTLLNSGVRNWALKTNVVAAGDFSIMRSPSNGTAPDTHTIYANSAGNVGIGTTSPESLLHVASGGAGGNALLRLENTNDDAFGPALLLQKDSASPANGDIVGYTIFRGDNNESATRDYGSIYVQSDDVNSTTEDSSFHFFNFVAGTETEVMTIEGGNVGIGTTSPTNAKLEVIQTAESEGLRVDGAGGGFSLIVDGGTGRDTHIKEATIGNTYASSAPPSDGLIVEGDVGIGTTTPGTWGNAPATDGPMLHIDEGTSSGSYDPVAFFVAGADADNSGALLRIGHDNDRGLEIKAGRRVGDVGHADFGVVDSGGTALHAMTLIQSGSDVDVGIGTTSPSTVLQVHTGAGNAAEGIDLTQGGANSGRIFFSNATSGAGFAIVKVNNLLQIGSGATPAVSSGTSRMVIRDDGNVGIGTATPSQKFSVIGGSGLIQGSSWASTGDTSTLYLGDTNHFIQSVFDKGINISSLGGNIFLEQSTGSVGIGTSTPQAPLEVVGVINASGDVYARGGQVVFSEAGTTNRDHISYDDAAFQSSAGMFTFHADTSIGGAALSPTAAISAEDAYFSGVVGIGDTSPDSPLDIEAANPVITLQDNDAGTPESLLGYISLRNSSGTEMAWMGDGGSGSYLTMFGGTGYSLNFGSNGVTERMVMDTNGLVAIGVNSPGSFDSWSNDLVVGTAASHEGITIYSGNSSGLGGHIFFADGFGGSLDQAGRVSYIHSSDQMQLYTGNAVGATLDSAGLDVVADLDVDGGDITDSGASWLEVSGCGANTGVSSVNSAGTITCIADSASDNYGSWTLAGTSGTPQTISSGNTATIAAGTGITTTAGATDTVTIAATLGTAIEKGEIANSGTLSFDWVDSEIADTLTISAGSVAGDVIVDGSIDASEIQDDVLDFIDFEDTLDLDSATQINVGTGEEFNIDLDGTADFQIRDVTTVFGDFQNDGDVSLGDGDEVFVDTSANSVGIGIQTPSAKLDVNGAVEINGNLDMQNNSIVDVWKVTLNTGGKVDPPYRVGDTVYSTYSPFMVGTKEEVTGTVMLNSNYVIDFGKLKKGSDLWLFYQVTDFGSFMENLQIILTPSFDGRVWYEKNPGANTITIHGTQAGEVSYRMTSNSWDWKSWGNTPPGLELDNYLDMGEK